jgi:hypothetical protein
VFDFARFEKKHYERFSDCRVLIQPGSLASLSLTVHSRFAIPDYSPTGTTGRYCCKSPKLFGTDFFVRKQKLLRSSINSAPNSFPKSPASLSPRNEVPHIFTQKWRQGPRKILVRSRKGLLQHNRPAATLNQAFWVSNQTPPAIKAIPASRGTSRPNGTTFSTNTNAERAAIQKRFMTPTTNKSAITAQQQPMQ